MTRGCVTGSYVYISMALLNDVELSTILVVTVEELTVIPTALSADASTDAKEADDRDNAAS